MDLAVRSEQRDVVVAPRFVDLTFGLSERLDALVGPRPGERLLELACGNGRALSRLARRAAGASLALGVDVALPRRAPEGVQFVRAEPMALLTGGREPWHVVAARFCLARLPWRGLLPLARTRLARGGRFGIVTSLGASVPEARAALGQLLEETRLQMPPPPIPGTASELASALDEAGFTAVDVEEHDLPLRFPDGLTALAFLRDAGFVRHPWLELLETETFQALALDFAERLETFRERDGVPLTLVCATAVARA